jgi:hypothetical protein
MDRRAVHETAITGGFPNRRYGRFSKPPLRAVLQTAITGGSSNRHYGRFFKPWIRIENPRQQRPARPT